MAQAQKHQGCSSCKSKFLSPFIRLNFFGNQWRLLHRPAAVVALFGVLRRSERRVAARYRRHRRETCVRARGAVGRGGAEPNSFREEKVDS